MKNHSLNLLAFLLLLSCLLMEFTFAQRAKRVQNPILAGFYPDPSICRVGTDFYLVNSSFAYFPGIPIFRSNNLVEWTLIGHVLDRPEQLNLDSLGVSRGIFAPAIRYRDGIFYVTCTLVDRGGNFVVTAKKPEGPWSNPVWLPEVNGIDPSLFFDDDGTSYLIYNSIAPENKPLYEGHRTIRMFKFDPIHLNVLGSERTLVNGGTDIAKRPVWIEGPHILRKDGYYFLLAAEGGTGDQHSEVVFRSQAVEGPYASYERNPVLTQRTLDPRREHPITCTGHADLVETPTGDWWAVFLGCRPYRPYEKGYYNTGRETFLAPVRWLNGWPVINPDYAEVQYTYPFPVNTSLRYEGIHYGGNFVVKDDFIGPTLPLDWVFLRTPRERWYSLTDRPGYLSLRLRPEKCSDPVNPSFIARRQQHQQCSAGIALDFVPEAENEKAGLLIFQNERHFYYLCASLADNVQVVELYKSTPSGRARDSMECIATRPLAGGSDVGRLRLKIEARGNTYAFLFAPLHGPWQVLQENVDAKFLSTQEAGGFVGCMYALYATSLGRASTNRAYVDWFEYRGDDEVYK